MENATQAPSCSVSSGAQPQREVDAQRDANNQVVVENNAEHNIFGDSNLNMVMMFMLMLHFMQYAMRERCGC